MYVFKRIEIRWNDLDANRHLANITFLSYASETRMAFMQKWVCLMPI